MSDKKPRDEAEAPAPARKATDFLSPGGTLPEDHWAQVRSGYPIMFGPVKIDSAGNSVSEPGDTSSISITSSILNYRTLHGRRYHSEIGNAQYWGSNDEQQSESMDINHHSLTIACGENLYLAPLDMDKVQQVLDIGTGTGIWAIDFADDNPDVEVIGTDISPIQPGWTPPNLKFEIEDCTGPWTFPHNSADYIHMRWLTGSIPDWYALMAEAYKTCRPGGWVESFEPSSNLESDHGEVPPDSAVGQWGGFFIEGGKKIGRTFEVVEDELQRKAMEAAGFESIGEFSFKTPLGTWPKHPILKELGTLTRLMMESDVEGYVLFMADVLGWTRDEIQVYLAHLRREVRANKYYAHYRQRVVWGRKPL